MELIGDLLPPGVLNVVNGFGLECGKPLASSNRIAKITFTGETTNGPLIMQYASQNIIPVTLELGGKSPNIFFEDVASKDDSVLDKALEGFAMFAPNQGEVCTCPSRALVQESIYERFMAVYCAMPAAAQTPLRIFAAGSLVGPVNELVGASGLAAGSVAPPVFGPAGLLRKRIEAGEAADVYASADLNQPRALVAAGRAASVVPFARNRMCVVSKASLGLTADNVLNRLLDPSVRLATSTPVSDPGGDYAWAVFERAERLRPGAQKTLRDRSMQLIGSPNAMVPVAGRSPSASIFLADRADALLYYCSGSAGTLREVPGLVSLPLPSQLEVGPVYGLVVMGDNPDAARFALFMLSEEGQTILSKYDLLPLSGP